MLQTVTATQARNNFSDLLNLVIYQNRRFVIKRKGKPVAVLSPNEEEKTNVRKAKNQVASVVDELTKFSLGVSDDWNQVEEVLKDLHEPH